jgi:hypothetical protein
MKKVKQIQLLSLIIIMAFMIFSLDLNAQGKKSDFSGTWTMNAQKSDQPAQGGGMRMGGGGGDFVAKQDANLLTVDRTRRNQNGEASTTTSKYTLDGKESVNDAGRGSSKSVAAWSADGKTLTIKTAMTLNMDGQARSINTIEVWNLTDAKTLAVKTTRTTPNGDMTTTAVYDKK